MSEVQLVLPTRPGSRPWAREHTTFLGLFERRTQGKRLSQICVTLGQILHCLTKNLPRRLMELVGVRESWRDFLLTKPAGVIGHGSIPLAVAPRAFPAGRLVCSACLTEACGFVRGDSVRGERRVPIPEDVSTAPFGVGNQPGQDLLQLPIKGVLVGTTPTQDTFSLFLLSVQGMESGCRTGNAPLDGNVSCCTTFNGKDANGRRRCL
jgi:hypothetical protein